MGKRYTIIMLCFLTASLFTTCRTHKESDISGIYKKKPIGNSSSYTEFIQLFNDGTFSITFTNESNSFMDYIIQCDTTKGKWQMHDESVILTTDCKNIDANDNIVQISPIEFSDSIKLKVVNFSDGSPVDMFFDYFDETSHDLILEKRTNDDGVVMLPDRVIPFYSDHTGSGKLITLEAGYYYQITYFDCFPIETYEQDTFLVRNDKLIKKSDKCIIWQKTNEKKLN